jgi:hypothetical protein
LIVAVRYVSFVSLGWVRVREFEIRSRLWHEECASEKRKPQTDLLLPPPRTELPASASRAIQFGDRPSTHQRTARVPTTNPHTCNRSTNHGYIQPCLGYIGGRDLYTVSDAGGVGGLWDAAGNEEGPWRVGAPAHVDAQQRWRRRLLLSAERRWSWNERNPSSASNKQRAAASLAPKPRGATSSSLRPKDPKEQSRQRDIVGRTAVREFVRRTRVLYPNPEILNTSSSDSTANIRQQETRPC